MNRLYSRLFRSILSDPLTLATVAGLPRRSSSPPTTVWTAILASLIAIAPVAAIADQHPAVAPDTRVAQVSLADLDLSTPVGQRMARERLQAMAQRVCAEGADGSDLSHQPNFPACVDNAVADALRQINSSTLNSVTRAANVSLADLDLSTPAGQHAARERLQAMAQRLCTELANSRELSYQPNFAACVDLTLTGALAQVHALAAAKESRVARRSAP
jgi:UrcA family protein